MTDKERIEKLEKMLEALLNFFSVEYAETEIRTGVVGEPFYKKGKIYNK